MHQATKPASKKNGSATAIHQYFLDALKNGGPDDYRNASDGVQCASFRVQEPDIERFPQLNGVSEVLVFAGSPDSQGDAGFELKTRGVTLRLVSSEHGFDDFNVIGAPSVGRICLPYDIKPGDNFNVYCDNDRKVGDIWQGTYSGAVGKLLDRKPMEEDSPVVIYSEELGVYLGGAMGMGFWSKLDPCGQMAACTFPSEAEARHHISIAQDGGFPEDVRFVPVMPDDGTYASIAACVKVGLPGWLDEDTLVVNSSMH